MHGAPEHVPAGASLSVKQQFDQVMTPNYAPLEIMPERGAGARLWDCLLYTSPSPRDATLSRMPSSA